MKAYYWKRIDNGIRGPVGRDQHLDTYIALCKAMGDEWAIYDADTDQCVYFPGTGRRKLLLLCK